MAPELFNLVLLESMTFQVAVILWLNEDLPGV